MNECIFCKFATGEMEPDGKVYEDETTLAFLAKSPNNHGHTLVIPKTHFENVYDLTDEAGAALMKTIRKTATALKKSLNADGVNILQNNEKAAGQAVFHVHFHIIPRFYKDGFKHWEKHTEYTGTQIKDFAEKIKKEMK